MDGVGAGIILTFPQGDKLRYVLYLDFTPCTNNMAKYEALLHGMQSAMEMNVNRLRFYGDSDLVGAQVVGTCNAISRTMVAYRQAVDQLGGHFAGYSVEWIDRRKNKEANAL